VRHTSDAQLRLSYHHRFPAEIISHSVWLYFRFAFSFRDVAEMLAMRAIVLSYGTIREWCLRFGRMLTTCDEDLLGLEPSGILMKSSSRLLDILLQSHRDKKAAKKFFRKLLKTLRYVPRGYVKLTDEEKRSPILLNTSAVRSAFS
jgi:putative transposase